ncbi:unnamed protein product [Lampetra fluviatilis]
MMLLLMLLLQGPSPRPQAWAKLPVSPSRATVSSPASPAGRVTSHARGPPCGTRAADPATFGPFPVNVAPLGQRSARAGKSRR